MDADQRAKLIRDLAESVSAAASYVALVSRRYRELMESDDPHMPPRDAVAAENGIEEAVRGIAEAKRVLAKRARLLDGTPPRLAIRSTDEPERLGIIARTPSGDLDVGWAVRDNGWWRIRLTDPDGSHRGSISASGDTVDELLEIVNRGMSADGPWWAPAGQPGIPVPDTEVPDDRA